MAKVYVVYAEFPGTEGFMVFDNEDEADKQARDMAKHGGIVQLSSAELKSKADVCTNPKCPVHNIAPMVSDGKGNAVLRRHGHKPS